MKIQSGKIFLLNYQLGGTTGQILAKASNTDNDVEWVDNEGGGLTEYSHILKVITATEKGALITLPAYYKVGNVLDVYYNGEKLIKTTSIDAAGTYGHYFENGNEGDIVNTIYLTTDWGADVGDVFEFVIKGEYSNDTE